MLTKSVTIKNATGLHARPASEFVQKAKGFESKILINREGEEPTSAKSVILLLSHGFCQGERVFISTEGEDAEEALDSLIALINSGFGEC